MNIYIYEMIRPGEKKLGPLDWRTGEVENNGQLFPVLFIYQVFSAISDSWFLLVKIRSLGDIDIYLNVFLRYLYIDFDLPIWIHFPYHE